MFTANLWMFPSSTPCVRASQRKSSETLVIAGVCQPWDRDMDMHQDSQKTKKSKKRDLRFSNTAKHIKAEVLCCYLFIGWMLPVALIHSFLFTIHPLHPLKCILLQLCPFGSLYNSGFSSRLNTVWGCRLAALSSWPFTASHSPTGLIWLRNCKGTGICETILFKSTFKSAVFFFFFFLSHWPTLQQLHKQLHQPMQGRAELWYKDLSPRSNCVDSELFNLHCCQRKFS